ncbi:MAG: hypothetical protein M1416_01740 [Candidatus Pacearchaeota archaeon]|nr:hypothetical protein [Candidatus Pacearchaeota archaeon]
MKKLADVIKKNGEILFTEKGIRIGDYMLPLIQDIFQEMTIKREEEGEIRYMSKKDIEDYQEYLKYKDEWDLK